MYSDLYIKRKRNPLAFVVVLSLFLVAGVGVFFSTFQPTITQASKVSVLDRKLVNLSFNQAGVYWTTEEVGTGWVIYGEEPDNLTFSASDERDSSGNRQPFKQHFVMLKNLKPDTTYYYKVVIDDTVIGDTNDEPFELTTTKQFSTVGATKPAYGKVTAKNGTPLELALVTVQFGNAVPLMTFSKATGEWLVPLQYVVDASSGTALALNPNDRLSITIQNDEGDASRIEAMVSKTNPFPQTIVLGNNYQFLQEESVLPASTSREQEATTEANESEVVNEIVIEEPEETVVIQQNYDDPIRIDFPRENASIPGTKPLIKGQALPETIVRLSINSQPAYQFQVVTNSRGAWKVNVPQPLQPGTYILSMSTTDTYGSPYYLERSFTILKSGEAVLGDATGAATLSPSPFVPQETPTTAPTTAVLPTDSPSPTIMPTLIEQEASPSPTTIIASASATPQPITITPTPPVTGANGLLYAFTAVGLLVVGAAAIIFL